jgi:hypothetical protein
MSSSASLSKRLTHLRAILAAQSANPNEWSRANLARAVDLSPAVIARLERSGTGTAANLLTLLTYYQCHGFNLAWMLASDDEQVPLYAFQDAFQCAEVTESCDYLVRLRKLVQQYRVDSRSGQEEALDNLLSSVLESTHQALVHLLPRIQKIGSKANLSVYHQHLPPVAAASAGWRSRSIHLLPLHYYDAGETVPRCGVLSYYLTYETEPTRFLNGLGCPFCEQKLSSR